MRTLSSIREITPRYIYNDCTAFLLISVNAIYSITIGLITMTHGGLLKHVNWNDAHFRKIVYWSLSDMSITTAVRLLYCWGAKRTAFKTAFLMVALLPAMPIFCATAGHEILKERDGHLAVLFISAAIMSLAINTLLSAGSSSKAIKHRSRIQLSSID